MAQTTTSVTCPLNTAPQGFISTDLQDLVLTASYSDYWRRFVQGLRTANATLNDGTPVVTTSHAMKWFLQQLGATG